MPDRSLPVEIRNLEVVRHEEAYARVHRGTLTGKRHQGGVTFDIIPGSAATDGVNHAN